MSRQSRLVVAVALAFGVAVPGPFATAQEPQPREVTSKLSAYKDQGFLPDYDHWFLQRLPDKPSLPDYIYHQIYVLCKERLQSKLNISEIRINERYVASSLNIYIVDPARDPMQLLDSLHTKGNDVSFPQQNLIVIDEGLLTRKPYSFASGEINIL